MLRVNKDDQLEWFNKRDCALTCFPGLEYH